MDNAGIKEFWESHPVGECLLAGRDAGAQDYASFFLAYDKLRYSTQPHMHRIFDSMDLKGKRVLEIGIGQASDAQQMIERGALYYGLDFSEVACRRAKIRFEIFKKRYKMIVCANAESLPFKDMTFDLVYSHGVLHHIPRIDKVSAEIERVTRKGGGLVLMLYSKNSLNYYLSILAIRRLLMVALFVFDRLTAGRLISHPLLRKHIDNARREGLLGYLRPGCFLSHNTDGPENPYSRVYTPAEARATFFGFRFSSFQQYFINERQLPLFRLLPRRLRDLIGRCAGWHLWCFGGKR